MVNIAWTEEYKECPECKKIFYKEPDVIWGYRKIIKEKIVDYCSWHCLRAAEKRRAHPCLYCGKLLHGKEKYCDTVCRAK